MTREEAIKWLKRIRACYKTFSNQKVAEKQVEAIDMAISALSEQVTSKLKNPCDSLLTEDSEDSKEQKSKLEPTKDCTDFLCWLLEEIMDEENWEMNAEADGEIIARKLKKLGLLDSKDGYYIRTPMYEALAEEERVGEWEHWGSPFSEDDIINTMVCTNCGMRFVEIKGEIFYYCPNCGAKMENKK